MFRQVNLSMKFIFILSLLSLVLLSCEEDIQIDTNAPSYHLSKSEQLVIPPAVELPANLPGGNTRTSTFFAVGVQKYKAQAKAGSPGTYEWVFVAPQADLYDMTNRKVGTHTAGPTWQMLGSTTDSIYAQHFSPVRSAPSPEAGTIDWLLLMPKTGKTPTGIFTNVEYIQRIATKGGKAPANLPTNANETVEVNYTAIYRFTRKNP